MISNFKGDVRQHSYKMGEFFPSFSFIVLNVEEFKSFNSFEVRDGVVSQLLSESEVCRISPAAASLLPNCRFLQNLDGSIFRLLFGWLVVRLSGR